MTDGLPERLRSLVDDLVRLCAAARPLLGGQPVFAHLRIERAGRPGAPRTTRDLLLGPRTATSPEVTVLDWRTAPLAEVFFACAEGEDYELEVEGRVLAGTVVLRTLLGFEGGELVEIAASGAILSRGEGGAWRVDPARGDAALLRPRVAEERAASEARIEPPLDPTQRSAVERPPGGALLVLGEAGCGKTTVALHRLAHLRRAAGGRFRGAVVVPSEGLRRFSQLILDRLGLDGIEVWHYDRWAAAQARHAFPDVPARESAHARAGIVRLKRHGALRVAIEALVVRRPTRGHEVRAAARRADLLLLFGDRGLMERVATASNGVVRAGDVSDVLAHTKVQFGTTTEEEYAHVDAERLVTIDEQRIDEGTPDEDAGSVDVEDYAALFEIDRRRRASARAAGVHVGGHGAEPRAYDCLVVDEAQELAPLELSLIGRAVGRSGTLIVAGDAGQQVDPTACFADWPTTMSDLGAPRYDETWLKVSYRNPPEVTALARRVLGRGVESEPAAPIAPSDPGLPPRVMHHRAPSECHLAAALIAALAALRADDPRATCAVICRTADGARRLAPILARGVDLHLALGGDFVFGPGINVTSVDEVKGLEFDYVIIPDASAALYPDTPEARRALYVAVTRTVHQCVLACVGTPTPLGAPL